MKKLIFILPILTLIIFAIILIIYNPVKTGISTKKVSVVAAENFWGNIASQIGGNKVQVVSIISEPNQDPHQYDSTANDARNISQADIVIESGLGYDTFMQKILSTTDNKTVINAGSIASLHEGDNPHVWYNLALVKHIALILKGDLILKDPSDSSIYTANYEKFIESFQPIETLCENIKMVYGGSAVIATERVADYQLNDCGLKPIPNTFQKSVEEGTDPSVQSVNAFQAVLNSHQVKVLIYNKQTVSKITDQMQSLAIKNNIPVVGVTETMPSGSTYQAWMLGQLHDIQKALQNG